MNKKIIEPVKLNEPFNEYGLFFPYPYSYLSNSKKLKKAFGHLGKNISKTINDLNINIYDIKDFELIIQEPVYEEYDFELDKKIKLKEPKLYIGFCFKVYKENNEGEK